MLTPKTVLGLIIAVVGAIMTFRYVLTALITGGALAAKGEGCVALTGFFGCGTIFSLLFVAMTIFGLRLAEIIQ
jgi:hypothetical protein